MIYLDLLLKATKGILRYPGQQSHFDAYSHDSRQLIPGELFVAVRGERSDGHDYLLDAVHRGATGLLVEERYINLLSEEAQTTLAQARPALRKQSRPSFPATLPPSKAGKTITTCWDCHSRSGAWKNATNTLCWRCPAIFQAKLKSCAGLHAHQLVSSPISARHNSNILALSSDWRQNYVHCLPFFHKQVQRLSTLMIC